MAKILEVYCPVCGEDMILREPRRQQTWKAFWGCSAFPKCKGARRRKSLANVTKDKRVPLDEAEILVRQMWQGKI